MPLPDGAAGMPGVIIPRMVVHDLIRMIDAKASGDVEIAIGGQAIGFTLDRTTLRADLLAGLARDIRRLA